jgi:DnaJ-class molecular chaperone
MAMQYHPDKYANATDKEKDEAEHKFKEINDAYQVLSDSQKKAQYDKFGHAAFEGAGGAGSGVVGLVVGVVAKTIMDSNEEFNSIDEDTSNESTYTSLFNQLDTQEDEEIVKEREDL